MTQSDGERNPLLSFIGAADFSSYYGIAIASVVVAGSALYYYANNKKSSSTTTKTSSSTSSTSSSKSLNKSKQRAPIIDFKNQTRIVSGLFFIYKLIDMFKHYVYIYICLSRHLMVVELLA